MQNTEEVINYYKNKFNNQFYLNDNIPNDNSQIKLWIITQFKSALELFSLLRNVNKRFTKDSLILIVNSLSINRTRWLYRTINLFKTFSEQFKVETILANPVALTTITNFVFNCEIKNEYYEALLTEDINLFNINVFTALKMQNVNYEPVMPFDFVTKPSTQNKVDVVFPLGDKPNDGEELRLALRSIDKNALDLGTVYCVTNREPDWLKNVQFIKGKDIFENNKDGNIIEKILAASRDPRVSERFIFWSDDQILAQPYNLRYHLPSFNNRGINIFKEKETINRWELRMIHTLQLINSYGGATMINWESHVPQPIDKTFFNEIFSQAPYEKLPGLCINTTYFGLKYEPMIVEQIAIKDTIEKTYNENMITGKPFIGYNDEGFSTGLKEKLYEMFPQPSKFQK